MTLLDLSEPLFQYVCRVNRCARQGAPPDALAVRAKVKAVLLEIASFASDDPELLAQFELVQPALVCFTDYMIRTSSIPNAEKWKPLAKDFDEDDGDARFFDMLNDALADPSEEAGQRIAVFYTCMGLGFGGWYAGQPEFLRQKMMECSVRIHGQMDADPTRLICPECYKNINDTDFIEPASERLIGIGIVLVGLILVLFVANFYLYLGTSRELGDILSGIAPRAVLSPAP